MDFEEQDTENPFLNYPTPSDLRIFFCTRKSRVNFTDTPCKNYFFWELWVAMSFWLAEFATKVEMMTSKQLM